MTNSERSTNTISKFMDTISRVKEETLKEVRSDYPGENTDFTEEVIDHVIFNLLTEIDGCGSSDRYSILDASGDLVNEFPVMLHEYYF